MTEIPLDEPSKQAPVKGLRQRLHQYALLMRLDKPIGIFLLLWPTLWALWVAGEGAPDYNILWVFIAGVVLMRSAGCVINDYADRDFDGFVERTQHRPLAAGRIKPREAIVLFIGLVSIAFLMVLTLNTLTILLSFVGAGLAASYPFTKRYTHLPQAYLGLAFGWGVPMAFAAQTGAIPWVAWLFLLATVFWALAYDTMYAMVDREDDLKIGVKSTAILFGKKDRLVIGIIQALMLITLYLAGRVLGLGWAYQLALLGALGFCIYHQYLIADRDPRQCFRAFLNNNWLGATIFAGLFAEYWMK